MVENSKRICSKSKKNFVIIKPQIVKKNCCVSSCLMKIDPKYFICIFGIWYFYCKCWKLFFLFEICQKLVKFFHGFERFNLWRAPMERLFVLLNSWDILFTLLSNSFDPRVMLSRRVLRTIASHERLPPGLSSENPLLSFASYFLVSQKQKKITNSVENWINSYFLRSTREKKSRVSENTKQLNIFVRTNTPFLPVILWFLLQLPFLS